MSKRQSQQMVTTINDDPKIILERLGLGGHYEAHYEALRGWQIATVHEGRNHLIDCVEEQGKVFIYQ